MSNLSTSVSFPTNNYTPYVYNVETPNPGCLTACDITPMTDVSWAAQAFTEVGMDKIIARSKMARIMGVRQRSLTDLILSRHAPLKMSGAASYPSIIAPFRQVPRKFMVNINYFQVTSGTATQPTDPATAWPSGLPATVYYLTVQVAKNTLTATTGGLGSSILNIERWFLPGHMMYVRTTGYHTGSYYQGYLGTSNVNQIVDVQYRIVCAVGKSGDTSTAYVAVAPTMFQSYESTPAAYTTAKTDDSTLYNSTLTLAEAYDMTAITKGTALIGTNSVHDKEAWGYQSPAVNDIGIKTLWQQTMRSFRSYDEHFVKAMTDPLLSEFVKMIRLMPLADQWRQKEAFEQIEWLNTVLYGDIISPYQTVANYTSLPKVEDLTNPGQYVWYKSNAIGIIPQLREASRTVDYNGGPVNLDTIFEVCYNMKRERENTGNTVNIIECMTDRWTKARIRDVMIPYLKDRFGFSINADLQINQKVLDALKGRTDWVYDSYELPDQGLELRVVQDPYFEDRLGAAQFTGATGNKDPFREMWFLDWSDITVNLISAKARKTQTNINLPEYNLVIDPNVNFYELRSKTFEIDVGNVNLHYVASNFSVGNPTVTVNIPYVPTSVPVAVSV